MHGHVCLQNEFTMRITLFFFTKNTLLERRRERERFTCRIFYKRKENSLQNLNSKVDPSKASYEEIEKNRRMKKFFFEKLSKLFECNSSFMQYLCANV